MVRNSPPVRCLCCAPVPSDASPSDAAKHHTRMSGCGHTTCYARKRKVQSFSACICAANWPSKRSSRTSPCSSNRRQRHWRTPPACSADANPDTHTWRKWYCARDVPMPPPAPMIATGLPAKRRYPAARSSNPACFSALAPANNCTQGKPAPRHPLPPTAPAPLHCRRVFAQVNVIKRHIQQLGQRPGSPSGNCACAARSKTAIGGFARKLPASQEIADSWDLLNG